MWIFCLLLCPLLVMDAQVIHEKEDKAARDFKPIVIIKENAVPTTCLAFTPDGKALGAVNDEDGVVRFWNAASGKKLANELRHSSGGPFKIAFSPDGILLAGIGYREKSMLLL